MHVDLEIAADPEVTALSGLQPVTQRGEDAARPVIRQPHLVDIDAAVLDDEIAARGHEGRAMLRRGLRRVVLVGGVLDDEAALPEQRFDRLDGPVVADVSLDEVDGVGVAWVCLRERVSWCGLGYVYRHDPGITDVAVCLQSTEPVAEPEGAPAELSADLDHCPGSSSRARSIARVR